MPIPPDEAPARAALDALRVATSPALVTAWGRAALETLLGVALVLSVWKGLPLTASVIAAGGLLAGVLGGRTKR